MLIQRGELFFVFLDPVFGREIGGYKTRPVVVISINDVNAKQLPVLVVPGTSAEGKPAHFKNVVRVEPTRDNGLRNPTLFQCHQVRALDQGRFTAAPIGRLSSKDLRAIEDAVKYVLGSPP